MVTVGIDEVGRGCWAGPLVAGAVILRQPIAGLRDSKKLSKSRREQLSVIIKSEALAYTLGWVTATEIDEHGLTWSVSTAMARAVAQLPVPFDDIIIDGNINYLADLSVSRVVPWKITIMVRADDLIPAVSAASIIAKVARDTYMADEAAVRYPQYGFDMHVGYGTAQHLAALQQFGVTPLHRHSFRPIRPFINP